MGDANGFFASIKKSGYESRSTPTIANTPARMKRHALSELRLATTVSVIVILLSSTGCESMGFIPWDNDYYLIHIVNHGDEDLAFTHAERWCYDGSDCPAPTGWQEARISPGQSSILSISTPNPSNIALNARAVIESGIGRFDIVTVGTMGGAVPTTHGAEIVFEGPGSAIVLWSQSIAAGDDLQVNWDN